MPSRVSTFTYSTLATLMSAATWNAWVDSWNAWLTFMGLSTFSHVAAGDPAFPRGVISGLQTSISGLLPGFLQDVAAADGVIFWPTHTMTTARAAAGLSGSDWTRQWFRQVANTTSATAYIDGDSFVNGELAYNRADGRVYLRGASSWTLQPRNTFATIKTGTGLARLYDLITSTLLNELAAVHQVIYYVGGGVGPGGSEGVFTVPPFGFGSSLYTDDGGRSGSSPGDFPPTTIGDTTAAAAESDADAAWTAATPSFSDTANGGGGGGEAGGPGNGPSIQNALAHKWRDSGFDWWQATKQTYPKKFGGTWASTFPVGTTVELWAKIIKWGTEYEGPYAENSVQQLGTITRGAGATGYLHLDFGAVSGWPAVTAHAYPTTDSSTRGCQTTRTQVRYDLRPVLPAP